MTTDDEPKMDYSLRLKQLQRELGGIDERRSALMTTIAGLNRLIAQQHDQQLDLPDLGPSHNGTPQVPAGFFKGKTPTQGYRDFKKLWPGDYKPPEIADVFQAGGMEVESRTKLVQAIHSVLKREREKAAREDVPAPHTINTVSTSRG